MTKFLRQTCRYQPAKRDSSGNIVLDKYGNPLYGATQTIKCRKERLVKDVLTPGGVALKSSTRYYTDDSNSIQPNDKLDGEYIVAVEEYVNGLGQTVGFESYV